jgi:hypothetical protein
MKFLKSAMALSVFSLTAYGQTVTAGHLYEPIVTVKELRTGVKQIKTVRPGDANPATGILETLRTPGVAVTAEIKNAVPYQVFSNSGPSFFMLRSDLQGRTSQGRATVCYFLEFAPDPKTNLVKVKDRKLLLKNLRRYDEARDGFIPAFEAPSMGIFEVEDSLGVAKKIACYVDIWGKAQEVKDWIFEDLQSIMKLFSDSSRVTVTSDDTAVFVQELE